LLRALALGVAKKCYFDNVVISVGGGCDKERAQRGEEKRRKAHEE